MNSGKGSAAGMRARESPASHPSLPAPPRAPSSRKLQPCMGRSLPPRPAQPHLWLCAPKAARLEHLVAMVLAGRPQRRGPRGWAPPLLEGFLRTACPLSLVGLAPAAATATGLEICDSPENRGCVGADVVPPAGGPRRPASCSLRSARYDRLPRQRCFPGLCRFNGPSWW